MIHDGIEEVAVMLREVVGAVGADGFAVDLRGEGEHHAVADARRIFAAETVPSQDAALIQQIDDRFCGLFGAPDEFVAISLFVIADIILRDLGGIAAADDLEDLGQPHAADPQSDLAE